MNNVVLEIPGDLAEALRVPPEGQKERLRQELVIYLYQKGRLSFSKACELAGMTRWEFHLLLGEEGSVRRVPRVEHPRAKQGKLS